MTRPSQIMEVAGTALAELNAELSAIRDRQLLAVASAVGSGSGNIDSTFGMDVRFRLVYVRCHFSGTSGYAAMNISLDSQAGSSYDARLYTLQKAGIGYDVNFRVPANESEDPSPWTFQGQDRVRIQWTNPGGITWGLEVGLALAS